MSVTTVCNYEITDTFSGEPNYSWVKRGEICRYSENVPSDVALIRRAKKIAGWNGLRCSVENYADCITIKPHGMCQVMFLTWHHFGNASH